MQESNGTIFKMKLDSSNETYEQPLSPTFDIEESHLNSDVTALSNFDENARQLKIKEEPDSSLVCQTCTDNTKAIKPRRDPAPICTLNNQSVSCSPTMVHNDETTRASSKSLTDPTTTSTPPMPKLYTDSRPTTFITEARPTTTYDATNQSRSFARSHQDPQFLQSPSKSRWNTRQSDVQKLIKQRTKEWKEKQALYQLMRNAPTHNPLKNSVSFPRGRGKQPGGEIIPRSAFSWYPRFVTPTEITHFRNYPYHVNGCYPIMAEYDANRHNNPDSAPKRRRSSDARFIDAEKLVIAEKSLIGPREPIIKDVLSLADTTSSNILEEGMEPKRCKRVKKSVDEANLEERRESVDSGNSENDVETLNSSGKYISDFPQTLQNTPEDHQVAHINGLLSLPSSRETRYGITYGELKRRCGAPEYLTRVDLVAYVRHSKSSGRSLLDKYGIVSANRASRPTIMSKMCENEARVLGDGILRMNMDYFPDKMLAEAATENLKETLEKEVGKDESKVEIKKSKIREKLQNIETTRSLLKEVFDLLHSEKDSEEIQRFELASHTFGTVNLKNHLSLFDRFFQEYQTSLITASEGFDFNP